MANLDKKGVKKIIYFGDTKYPGIFNIIYETKTNPFSCFYTACHFGFGMSYFT